MRSWAHGVAFFFNIQIDVVGNPPEAPFFIVSNHMSYLDIVPLYLNLRCTFVAKKEVRSWPVIGFMVKAVGVIFIDRNRRGDVRRVNELLNKSLNEYQGMIVFPEGTSSGGRDVLPFHTSLLQLPATANQPVHYCSLYYETGTGDPPADHSVCFWELEKDLLLYFSKKNKIRYRYDDNEFYINIPFVGYQPPIPFIPAGTVVRLSLARWWAGTGEEPRCYLQLSGWYDEISIKNRLPHN
jgi:1-acyl-sn-glycerol-3-phosphate acyltransferase